jgi:REP element-mobilizing transposase RayT
MPKFKNFPGRPGRAPFWNYQQYGVYFVTINTFNRVRYFGRVREKRMQLYPAGAKVAEVWQLIPEQFSFVRIDEFVVMPDHIHGILAVQGAPPRLASDKSVPERLLPIPKRGGATGEANPMLGQNLSRVIRWFKGRCTYEIRQFLPGFTWQSHFDDSVITNYDAWVRVRQYIRKNPEQWKGGEN